jgi:hypothetical protein
LIWPPTSTSVLDPRSVALDVRQRFPEARRRVLMTTEDVRVMSQPLGSPVPYEKM